MGLKIKDLFENNNTKFAIPKTSGIYIVKAPKDFKISLKKEPDGFQETHKGKLKNIYYNVSDRLETLNDNNADTSILYYGRATNLRNRIMQYVKFGYKYKAYDNHAGGRAIWYIENNKLLEFEYIESDNFKKLEANLIKAYEEEYGCKPLANIKNGELN